MKKVLIILPDKLKRPVGGIGVQCKEITSRLSNKYKFTIVGQPEDNENYVSVYNPLPIPHSSLVTLYGQTEYFFKAIQCEKPDLVHAYDWSTFMAGYYTAQFFKVPLVLTMQLSVNLLENIGVTYCNDVNSVDGYYLQQCHKEIEKFVLEKADTVIQVSNAYAKKFIGIENKTVLIPNGIDLNDFSKYTPQKLPKGINIVYIGRFAQMKGITELLKVNLPKGVNMHFVGRKEGSEGTLYEQVLEKCKTPNWYYHDYKIGQDKTDFLCSCDALICPSNHEPFGIVALEGLASQCIVLSSFIDGMSDFLTDDVAINCGFNSATIENAIHRLLNMDKKEKEKRIKKGLDICNLYTWDNAANLTDQTYTNLTQPLQP